MNEPLHGNIYGSIREYLHGLEESGLEGLPVEHAAEVQSVVSGSATFSVTLPKVDQQADTTLSELNMQISNCTGCRLWQSRRNVVTGSGDPGARLMFIGEAPGVEDDRQGVPFSGAAGQILTRMIVGMGLERGQVYICNLLNCIPPERTPDPDELAACRPFLLRQIELVRPELIVTLGTCAAQELLGSSKALSELRGRFHDFNGIPLLATLHPAFLLQHQHNRQLFWDVWDDMVQVLQRLGLPVPQKKKG